MSIEAKVVADSVSQTGKRITTLELVYPRFIHSEIMTHRMFSRNAASSRAIPVRRTVEQIMYRPSLPVHFGQEKKGMQTGEKIPTVDWAFCWDSIMAHRIAAIHLAENLTAHGLHKSIVNRYLEPWQEMKMIVTSTSWGNFFALRDHKDAEKHLAELAKKMKQAIQTNVPSLSIIHLPYVNDLIMDTNTAIKASVARCARVSYLLHDGTKPDISKDIALHDQLLASGHFSPFEHIAHPLSSYYDKVANFQGWKSYRSELPNENQESGFDYDRPNLQNS